MRPRTLRREVAGASDDGSDSDDSYVQGESSIIHRLSDVEAVISDQSIQIENLENKMTEGFNQMRPLTTYQYSCLSERLSSKFEQLLNL